MPGFDGTGPEGRGSFGRRMGPCGEGEPPGFAFFRRGRRGAGRGFRWFQTRFFDENTNLEAEKNFLEKRLDAVKQQMDQIKQNQ